MYLKLKVPFIPATLLSLNTLLIFAVMFSSHKKTNFYQPNRACNDTFCFDQSQVNWTVVVVPSRNAALLYV